MSGHRLVLSSSSFHVTRREEKGREDEEALRWEFAVPAPLWGEGIGKRWAPWPALICFFPHASALGFLDGDRCPGLLEPH